MHRNTPRKQLSTRNALQNNFNLEMAHEKRRKRGKKGGREREREREREGGGRGGEERDTQKVNKTYYSGDGVN